MRREMPSADIYSITVLIAELGSSRQPDYLDMRLITISLKLPGCPLATRYQCGAVSGWANAGPTLGLR